MHLCSYILEVTTLVWFVICRHFLFTMEQSLLYLSHTKYFVSILRKPTYHVKSIFLLLVFHINAWCCRGYFRSSRGVWFRSCFQPVDHYVAFVLQIPCRQLCCPTLQQPASSLSRSWHERLLHPHPAPQHFWANRPPARPSWAQSFPLHPAWTPQQSPLPRNGPLPHQDRWHWYSELNLCDILFEEKCSSFLWGFSVASE